MSCLNFKWKNDVPIITFSVPSRVKLQPFPSHVIQPCRKQQRHLKCQKEAGMNKKKTEKHGKTFDGLFGISAFLHRFTFAWEQITYSRVKQKNFFLERKYFRLLNTPCPSLFCVLHTMEIRCVGSIRELQTHMFGRWFTAAAVYARRAPVRARTIRRTMVLERDNERYVIERFELSILKLLLHTHPREIP